MVALVDASLIRAHIDSLLVVVAQGQRLLASARRWPWKQDDVLRLLYELAQTNVVAGINCCAIGESERARPMFVEAGRLAVERFERLSQRQRKFFLGYHDIQIVAATFIVGADDLASLAAKYAIANVAEHVNRDMQTAHTGARSLLDWLLRRDVLIDEIPGAARDDQFVLWGRISATAVGRDERGLRESFDDLAKLVAADVRRGEFRYSEDRLAYLPGQMIVKLAKRDGYSLNPPPQAWWKSCF